MVNLPPSDQPARAMGERGGVRRPRSHHNWEARFGRRGNRQHTEPKGLLELEALAKRAVEVMERHVPRSEGDNERIMDLLRLQYNLVTMVNLPPSDQPARAMGERGGVRRPRSHHNWGASFGRRGNRQHTEPKGLLELEALAKRAIEVMERHVPRSEGDYERVMDLLRLQYNLNFILVCEKCRGRHDHDELIAPER